MLGASVLVVVLVNWIDSDAPYPSFWDNIQEWVFGIVSVFAAICICFYGGRSLFRLLYRMKIY
jgi:hypothetical protein